MTAQLLPLEPPLWADEVLPARGFVEKASGLTQEESREKAEKLRRQHPGQAVRRTHRIEGKREVWRVWLQQGKA